MGEHEQRGEEEAPDERKTTTTDGALASEQQAPMPSDATAAMYHMTRFIVFPERQGVFFFSFNSTCSTAMARALAAPEVSSSARRVGKYRKTHAPDALSTITFSTCTLRPVCCYSSCQPAPRVLLAILLFV